MNETGPAAAKSAPAAARSAAETAPATAGASGLVAAPAAGRGPQTDQRSGPGAQASSESLTERPAPEFAADLEAEVSARVLGVRRHGL